MKLISFNVSKEYSYREEEQKFNVSAKVETDDGTKMEIQFRPDLVPVVLKGLVQMVQIAVQRTAAPLKHEKMQDPVLLLPNAVEVAA